MGLKRKETHEGLSFGVYTVYKADKGRRSLCRTLQKNHENVSWLMIVSLTSTVGW